MIRSVLLVLALSLVTPRLTAAQSWGSVLGLGGSGNDGLIASSCDRLGNTVVLGSFTGSVTFDTISLQGSSYTNIFLAAYSRTGHALWARVVSTAEPVTGTVSATALALDGVGNIFITGGYTGSATIVGEVHSSAAPTEIFVAKLDALGDKLWVKTAGGSGVGTFNANISYAVAADSTGNCVIAGRYYRQAKFDELEISSELPAEMFVASYDAMGHIRWVQTGRGDFGIHNPNALAVDREGNTYVTGSFFGHLGFGTDTIDAIDAEQKMFISKLRADGSVEWAKKVGTGGYYGTATSLAVNSAGDVVLAGYFRSSIDLGPYHFTHNGPSVTYTSVTAGYTNTGDLRWANYANGDDSHLTAITSDSSGVIVAGAFLGSMTLGTLDAVSNPGQTSFLARMDGAGSWQWLRAAASNAANSASGIGIRANAQVVLAGTYRDSITFGSKKLWARGGLDVYLATIDGSTATVREDQASRMIYPNPADRELHMTGAADQVQLQDLLGRTFTLRSENGRVDVSNLSAGVYHVGGTQVLIVH